MGWDGEEVGVQEGDKGCEEVEEGGIARDGHLDIPMGGGWEGSEPLAGAVCSHLVSHPPAPTERRTGGQEVTPAGLSLSLVTILTSQDGGQGRGR